ncbi:MAG: type 2 isopentenyl-diphosphate Delta-isomerase [Leucobacter sp.]
MSAAASDAATAGGITASGPVSEEPGGGIAAGSERAARKDDHVRLARAQRSDAPGGNEFDDVEFVHHALGGVDASRVDLSTRVGDWRWATPFYANGMTGGTEWTTRINRELAIAARETGMPMACGSVSVALDDAEAASGFAVIREENPSGFVMANLGVGRGADDAVRAVELLRADALQLHLNAVQETAMPEGTRDFSSWERSVESIVAASPVPVIVKEVGFGLSRRTLERLAGLGVGIADVSGAGGTDFLRIENARHDAESRGSGGDFSMLSGFGQSAMACLLDAPADGPTLLASGGVRNPFDAVKALAAGASAVGVAGTFLEAVLDGGAEALVPLIERWIAQTTAILALLGAETPADLASTDLIVRGRLAEFCRLRGVDLAALAARSRT